MKYLYLFSNEIFPIPGVLVGCGKTLALGMFLETKHGLVKERASRWSSQVWLRSHRGGILLFRGKAVPAKAWRERKGNEA